MKEIKLKNVNDVHDFLRKFIKKPSYKYRGQSNYDWKLVSKVGRYPNITKIDNEIFRQWKRRAVSYLPKQYSSDIEYLSVAQHTGLMTRLLDWSHNPLIGLFFAVNEEFNKDGALFLNKVTVEKIVKLSEFDPFNIGKDYILYQPLSTVNRMDNQFGYFTIQKDINKPFEEVCNKKDLLKIRIKKEMKEDILFMLNQYGINNLTVYPDLEGLSKHLNWFYENHSMWESSGEII